MTDRCFMRDAGADALPISGSPGAGPPTGAAGTVDSARPFAPSTSVTGATNRYPSVLAVSIYTVPGGSDNARRSMAT